MLVASYMKLEAAKSQCWLDGHMCRVSEKKALADESVGSFKLVT